MAPLPWGVTQNKTSWSCRCATQSALPATADPPCTGLPVISWLLWGPAAAGAATQGAAVGLIRSALLLLLMTPSALSAGRASCGKGLPVAGLGQGAVVGLLGGLCVSGLCVGGRGWCEPPPVLLELGALSRPALSAAAAAAAEVLGAPAAASCRGGGSMCV